MYLIFCFETLSLVRDEEGKPYLWKDFAMAVSFTNSSTSPNTYLMISVPMEQYITYTGKVTLL